MSEGLVVASCGAYCFSVPKSPVSATTVVKFLSCSSWLSARLASGFWISATGLIDFFTATLPHPANKCNPLQESEVSEFCFGGCAAEHVLSGGRTRHIALGSQTCSNCYKLETRRRNAD